MDFKNHSRIRTLLFAILLVYIFGAPLYRQVLGGQNKLFRNWVMFAGKGLGTIQVDFFAYEHGAFTPIDRFAILKGPRSPKNKKLWLIKSKKQLKRITQELCAKTRQDIRVSARQAKRSGWVTIGRKTTKLCTGPQK